MRGERKPADLPIGEALHPVALIAVVVLVVNDWVLKPSSVPAWLTGKLSDVSGLVFAPLVLILDSMGHSTRMTVIACAVYFWARLAHAIVYALGIPVARTLAFAVGVVAQAMLVLAVFGKL